MDDFLEVTGASGVAYRFRRARPEDLPATAGNLLVATGRTSRVLFCASARSLAVTASTLSDMLKAKRAARLYIRLNVAGTVRAAEHADIVAGVLPETEVAELD
jgi:hypothetical protein